MLELICKIPDPIGWALVGSLGTLCGIMLYKLIALFVQMYKERKEDAENDD